MKVLSLPFLFTESSPSLGYVYRRKLYKHTEDNLKQLKMRWIALLNCPMFGLQDLMTKRIAPIIDTFTLDDFTVIIEKYNRNYHEFEVHSALFTYFKPTVDNLSKFLVYYRHRVGGLELYYHKRDIKHYSFLLNVANYKNSDSNIQNDSSTVYLQDSNSKFGCNVLTVANAKKLLNTVLNKEIKYREFTTQNKLEIVNIDNLAAQHYDDAFPLTYSADNEATTAITVDCYRQFYNNVSSMQPLKNTIKDIMLMVATNRDDISVFNKQFFVVDSRKVRVYRDVENIIFKYFDNDDDNNGDGKIENYPASSEDESDKENDYYLVP